MIIVQDFIPAGRGNRPGRLNPMKFITIHNTGNTNAGANAKSHAAYLKSDAAAKAPTSWHYTVDEHGAYQHLPDNEDAYHAGDGSGNGNRESIAIEICMNSDGNQVKATDNAATLAANLCKQYSIPIANVVQHNRWSGKHCPQMLREGRPYSWETFLGIVAGRAAQHWAKPSLEYLRGIGLTINEERYGDPVTRGELFALLERYDRLKK